MSLAIIHCRAELGIAAPPVQVEVHVAGGLPGMTIVGLPATAVREAKDRVRAALQNSGFSIPPRRITINLAPADLPKDGGRFDLAMAIGILQASDQLRADLHDVELIGELSLSGELRPVASLLPSVMASRRSGRALVVPVACADQAVIARHPRLRMADHLLAVCAGLKDASAWPALPLRPPVSALPEWRDLGEVRGHARARRALEVAASGRHNLLLLGPPGSGKSLLASTLPGLCPELTEAEALELASIESASHGGFRTERWRQVPFRNPHHSSTAAAMAGGGGIPRPGEISLAHHGVLFLDELPEFRRGVLEVLREPMETGQVRIARVRQRIDYPARFQLVAAMNPCPCGYLGDPSGRCHCSRDAVQRYRGRVSGPLLDRVDLQILVPRLPPAELLQTAKRPAEGSAAVRQRVCAARQRQLDRSGCLNAELPPEALEQVCRMETPARELLQQAGERLQLSGRSLHRVMKVARTIADLEYSEIVTVSHLAEALQYRQL